MAAEQQYIDIFLECGSAINKHSSELLNSKRAEAFENFKKNGFPTRKVEKYKYTDADELFAPDYGLNINRLDIPVNPYKVFKCEIDAILSSKPEDRRAVFEEAAGITKFKADRKEALRKIEQTEQNLLREADVLREMKRQIGSLQRQVGKAQKYRELRDELKGLDIYVSKQRIHGYDVELEQNATNRQEIDKAIAEATAIVVESERQQQELHAQVHELEDRLQTLASRQAAADSAYGRANEGIGVNASRIEEYKQFADRDEREISDTKAQLEEVGMRSEEHTSDSSHQIISYAVFCLKKKKRTSKRKKKKDTGALKRITTRSRSG